MNGDYQKIIVVKVDVSGILFRENNVDSSHSHIFSGKSGDITFAICLVPFGNTSNNGVRYMMQDLVSHLQIKKGDDRVRVEDVT